MRARARRLLELLRDAVTNPTTIRAVVVLGCACVGYSLSSEATEAATVLGVVVGQVIAVLLPVRRSTKQ
jgi:hypothetical protein